MVARQNKTECTEKIDDDEDGTEIWVVARK